MATTDGLTGPMREAFVEFIDALGYKSHNILADNWDEDGYYSIVRDEAGNKVIHEKRGFPEIATEWLTWNDDDGKKIIAYYRNMVTF